MRVCVFLGPTLARSAARAVWDEPTYLPPVRQGELYAAARRRPVAIGVVDGYFADVPAVWHKEILWAMSEGIHVFGASSMGALRAVELARFGMRGVGEVFASLARGDWEDEDEVAVVHGPAELGYPALSEAMVNIRATLERAVAERVVAVPLARRLVALAKARPYAERDYTRLLADAAAESDIDPAALAAFERWLPDGRVDRKAEDATRLIETLRDSVEALAAEPPRVDYRFEATDAWLRVLERGVDAPPPDSAAALALERIKLDGTWRARAPAALLRHTLAVGRGSASGPLDAERLASARDMLRRSHGLWSAGAFADWKRANGLDEHDFSDLLACEARVRHAAVPAAALDAFVVRELQSSGDYAAYLREGERMRRALHAPDPVRSESEATPTLHALLAMNGIEIDAAPGAGPDDPESIAAYAHRTGFDDAASLHRALINAHRLAESDAHAGADTGASSEPSSAP